MAIQSNSILHAHLALLLEKDELFRKYWGEKDSAEQDTATALAAQTESIVTNRDDLRAKFLESAELARRFLSCVPQVDMDYRRRPRDWLEFVGDNHAKEALLCAARSILDDFVHGCRYEGSARVYGNIKSIESLDEKLGERKSGSAARRYLRDTWDAVRFRIIASDLCVLRQLAVEIWQYFIDDIVRCRNYFMYRRTDELPDPYAAIHFELEVTRDRWVEVQLLTEGRDLAGFLDHALVFKKRIAYLSNDHEQWLHDFRKKVTILDNMHVPLNGVRRPHVGIDSC